MSNLRQLAIAGVLYLKDNRDRLPRPAEGPPQKPWDFVYWQPAGSGAPYDDVNKSGYTPYLGSAAKFQVEMMICPSDPVAEHWTTYGTRPPYPFSYSMNAWISSDNSRSNSTTNINPPIKRMGQVRNATRKIWIVDESERTINDGMFAPEPNTTDTVADRHEPRRTQTDQVGRMTNGRGNVVYCDGHAEFTNREDVHNINFYHPYK